MSIVSTVFRMQCRKNDRKRDAGLKTPGDIERYDDIVYGPDKKRNVLDVYRPKGAEGRIPVIVSVHGGGWVYGDKELYQYYCMSLAQQGFAVVNFTYRLAPRFKFPAQLEDTARAFAWTLAHADEYGLDTDRLFAVGDSAGAHLLALYCCACNDSAYARELGFEPAPGSLPKAVALNCGVYIVEMPEKKDHMTTLMEDILPGRLTPELLKSISPVDHVVPGFPPAFVMTAEGDFLAEEAPPMVAKLQSLGCEAEYHYYGDPEHVLGHVFHCNMRSGFAAQCNADECSFFRRYC